MNTEIKKLLNLIPQYNGFNVWDVSSKKFLSKKEIINTYNNYWFESWRDYLKEATQEELKNHKNTSEKDKWEYWKECYSDCEDMLLFIKLPERIFGIYPYSEEYIKEIQNLLSIKEVKE